MENNNISINLKNNYAQNSNNNIYKKLGSNGEVDVSELDLSKISTTSYGAMHDDFIKVNNKTWENSNLSYEVKENGSVLIKNDQGIPLGWTNGEYIDKIVGINDKDIVVTDLNSAASTFIQGTSSRIEKHGDVIYKYDFDGKLSEKNFVNGNVEYYSNDELIGVKYTNDIYHDYSNLPSLTYENENYEVDLSILLDDKLSFITSEMLSNASINVTDNVVDVIFSDNSEILLSNDFVVGKNSQGNINYGYHIENGNLDDIDIFGNYNIDSYQYGGNQMVFCDNASELLQDDFIINELREKFPGAGMQEYERYLNDLGCSGCGHTALVDSVFKNYEGREEEFYNTFGFNMYDIDSSGNLNYNYEYLILKWYDYNLSGYSLEQIATDEVYKGISPAFEKNFQTFLADEYGVQTNQLTDSSIYNRSREEFMEMYNNTVGTSGKIHMYMASAGYNLYDMDGNLTCVNGGGHAMYITDINDDGNLIVSSWGQKYILDLSDVEANGGDVRLYNFEFVN